MVHTITFVVLLLSQIVSSAAEYKELTIDNYPGWGDQKLLSQQSTGRGTVITFIPADSKSVDDPRGALYVFMTGRWTDKAGVDVTPLDIIAMMAVSQSIRNESGCSIQLLKYRDEIREQIPHFLATFYIQCEESISHVGALIATKVNGKVAVILRPIALGKNANFAKIDKPTDEIVFDSRLDAEKKELGNALEYIERVGK